MPNNNDRRVLIRLGARELTLEEMERILGSGGNKNTHASLIPTGTPSSPDENFDS